MFWGGFIKPFLDRFLELYTTSNREWWYLTRNEIAIVVA